MTAWIAHRPHGPRADRYFQTSAAVLCDAPSPIEATSSVAPLIGHQYGAVEWIGNLRGDNFVSGEVLFSLVAEGGPPTEWLATEAVVMPDANLMLEVDGVASTIVVSIESGPTRVRLLASPGRIRLLRRN
jgi:hypothetical protein